MRWLLGLWAAPLVLFWGWYLLSYNDLHFGYVILSRRLHDLVFIVYGKLLGIEPDTIAPMLAKACVIDTVLLMAFIAFRRRKAIHAWVKARRARLSGESQIPSA